MPNKQAAKKYLRKSHKRYLRNQKIKKNLKSILKDTRKLISDAKIEEAEKGLKKAAHALDKAAQANIIKKNTAARKKSRLASALKKRKNKKG